MRFLIATSLAAFVAAADAAPPGDTEGKTETCKIATTKGVITAFARTEAERPRFVVTAVDAADPPRPDQTATCVVPADREKIAMYRLALLSSLDGTTLRGFEVTTAKPGSTAPAADGEPWLQFEIVGGVATQRIESEAAIVLRPRFEDVPAEEGCGDTDAPPRKRLAGFELVAMAAPRDTGGELEEAAKEMPAASADRTVSRLDLPPAPKNGVRYGVLLRPLWKEPGRLITGYEARLISTKGGEPKPTD